jgi:hypothetical protein
MASSLKEKQAGFNVEDNSSSDHDVDLQDTERRLQQMTAECPPFYKNRNLLILYLAIIPGCLVPAITLGYDGSMMNGLQAVPYWDRCKLTSCDSARFFDVDQHADFGKPRGALLGILNAILPLGCILATPFISMVGDRHGRRWGIFLGGLIMCIGGIIQACSVHRELKIIQRYELCSRSYS